jgi:hypothetical protein
MKLKLGLLTISCLTFINAHSLAVVTCKDLYLDLMKKSLLNSIYQDSNYNSNAREDGRDWPSTAHTMIGKKRLDNVQFCCEETLKNNIPGDFIETGVWRGGTVIFMRAILKAYNSTDRIAWAADSFEGLPIPNTAQYPADNGLNLYQCKELAISLEAVQENFRRYGLLDSQVRFLKGWFKDTLPQAPIEKIAVLRLDGDLYESTMDALKNLYSKVSIGGFIIIDDYGCISACAKAVDDFRTQHNITDEIKKVDWTGVFWQRSK